MVLILEDGKRAPMNRFEHTPSTYRITVEPGEALPVTLVFKPAVPHNPWLDDVSLEIAAENRRPAVLRLNGTAVASNHPISAVVDQTSTDGNGGDGGTAVKVGRSEIDVALTSARIDINAGPYRATRDEQLVVVELTVTRRHGSTDRTQSRGTTEWLKRAFWQMHLVGLDSADADERIAPQHVSSFPTRGGDDGSVSQALELIFTVPADIEVPEMVLMAGSERVKIGSIHPGSVAN